MRVDAERHENPNSAKEINPELKIEIAEDVLLAAIHNGAKLTLALTAAMKLQMTYQDARRVYYDLMERGLVGLDNTFSPHLTAPGHELYQQRTLGSVDAIRMADVVVQNDEYTNELGSRLLTLAEIENPKDTETQ